MSLLPYQGPFQTLDDNEYIFGKRACWELTWADKITIYHRMP